MREGMTRLLVAASVMLAGCNFAVHGIDLTGGSPPGTGGGAPPTSSTQPDMSGPVVSPDDGGADLNPGQQSPTPDLLSPPGHIGDPCDSMHPCDPSLMCFTQAGGDPPTPLPGGYCTRPCGAGCPNGSACVDVGGTSLCMLTCGSCRTGYKCCDKGGTAVCVPDGACGG